MGASSEGGTPHAGRYDAIRHAAALAVLFGHSFVLTRGTDPLSAALMPLAGWGEGVHELAVNVFFALSGYLVTLSLLRRDSVVAFAIARALRIWPAAILACVLTVLAGAAFTTLPVQDYATAEGTWRFLVRNIVLRKIEYGLPGVFADNPYPNVVNGSLWSLPYELRFYAFTALIGLAGVFRRRLWFNLLLAASVLDFLVPVVDVFPAGETTWRLWLHFFGGAALAVNRDVIPLRAGIAVALAGLALGAAVVVRGPVHAAAFATATVYAVHWIGQGGGSVRGARRADLSYGIYLFAFPVQQGLISLAPAGWNGWTLTLASVPFVLALAALSWHAVEHPALARREDAIALAQRALMRLRPRRPAIPPAGR